MKNILYLLAIVFLVLISSCSKYPDLGNGYRLESDGSNSLEIVNFENTIMIGQHILDYSFDSTFIIVAQRPLDSVPGMRTMTYNNYWKAFEKSTFIQYWILNKIEKNVYSYDSTRKIAIYSNVYGPYNKTEYFRKREEMKIPKELMLKSN
jgi:hypothetical protein